MIIKEINDLYLNNLLIEELKVFEATTLECGKLTKLSNINELILELEEELFNGN